MSKRFTNILFPTDFSDLARPALDYAKGLAEAFDAQIHCLHVVDDAYQYWSAIGPESLPVGPPPDEMIALGRTRLARFAAESLSDLKRPAVTHVAYGRPFHEIINYARENNIDLIVMSTHGRGVIAHALLGSTTEKVVRKACCPVLTIRAAQQKGQAS